MASTGEYDQPGRQPHESQDCPAYSEEAAKYLDDMGLRHLTQPELDAIADGFSSDMLAGIEGHSRSLAMYETCLTPIDLRQLPTGKRAFAAEVGGTHVRGAIVEVGNDGYPQIVDGLYSQAPLGKTDFTDATEFVTAISARIDQRVLQHIDKVDAAAYIYAFAGTAIETEYGIDVVSTPQLSKEIEVKGIETQPVGTSFFRPLVPFQNNPPFPLIVGNDTPFVLQSGGIDPLWLIKIITNRYPHLSNDRELNPDIEARISMGIVNSSGMNIAILINGVIYNIEAGNYDHVPTHTIAEIVDKESKEPSRQLAEKQVSANWLGAQMNVLARQMAASGLLQHRPTNALTSVLVTDLLNDNRAQVKAAMEQQLDSYPYAVLATAAERMRTRSAQIFGTIVGAGIRTYPQQFGDLAVIPCESTLMRHVPGYQAIVEEQVRNAGGVDPLFVHIPNAGILGAGAAALARLA